jgi:N-acetylneuraminic acid mutarotase
MESTVSYQWKKLEFPSKSHGSACPGGRWGFSAVNIGHNKTIIYGGEDNNENSLGDVHIYDAATGLWESPVNVDSSVRSWHSATYIESKCMMLVFGGERRIFGDTPECIGEVMVLDCSDPGMFMWYPPELNGKPPSARAGHSCSLVGNELVFFGGFRGRSYLNDVVTLNINTWRWSRPEILGNPPEARCYHSATVVDKKVIIMGGNTHNKCLNQVYVLDTSGATWKWVTPKVSGDIMLPVTGVASLRISDSHILYHGGWDSMTDDDSIYYESVWVLNTDTMRFKKYSSSLMKMNRVGHQLSLYTSEKCCGVISFLGQDEQEERSTDNVCFFKLDKNDFGIC